MIEFDDFLKVDMRVGRVLGNLADPVAVIISAAGQTWYQAVATFSISIVCGAPAQRPGPGESPFAQIPIASASSRRWWWTPPNINDVLLARLKYKCVSCSHVKPVPPRIWIVSEAAVT